MLTGGIGLSTASMDFAKAFSKPLVGEVGRERLGLGLLVLTGLRARGMSWRKPIVRLKLE